MRRRHDDEAYPCEVKRDHISADTSPQDGPTPSQQGEFIAVACMMLFSALVAGAGIALYWLLDDTCYGSMCIPIILNGGLPTEVVTSVKLLNDDGNAHGDDNGWRHPLHIAFPQASRIELWSAAGEALLWSYRDGGAGGFGEESDVDRAARRAHDVARAGDAESPLYAILDGHPFELPGDAQSARGAQRG